MWHPLCLNTHMLVLSCTCVDTQQIHKMRQITQAVFLPTLFRAVWPPLMLGQLLSFWSMLPVGFLLHLG